MNRFKGYKEASISGSSTRFQSGVTHESYDANGPLTGVTDSTQGANNRSFVNDVAGRALYVNQGGHIERQLIVNSEVLGRFGVGIDEVNPKVCSRWRVPPASRHRPTMPLRMIMTAANTVSRASAAAVGPQASRPGTSISISA